MNPIGTQFAKWSGVWGAIFSPPAMVISDPRRLNLGKLEEFQHDLTRNNPECLNFWILFSSPVLWLLMLIAFSWMVIPPVAWSIKLPLAFQAHDFGRLRGSAAFWKDQDRVLHAFQHGKLSFAKRCSLHVVPTEAPMSADNLGGSSMGSNSRHSTCSYGQSPQVDLSSKIYGGFRRNRGTPSHHPIWVGFSIIYTYVKKKIYRYI